MLGVALSWMLALGQVAAPSSPQGTTSGGNAVIRGRVIDKASGAPLVNAVVSLQNQRERSGQQKHTDDRGRFEFTGVPAGQYELRASAGLYRATHVPASYPQSSSATNPVLTVKGDEERSDIEIVLARALAINGRVTDEAGAPLAQIAIALTGFVGGMRMTNSQLITDDRGVFRLYGLAPGRYTVCAEMRGGLSFDVQPRRRRQYMRSCYGDGSTESEIVLTEADVDGVEIRMPRRPTLMITGVVVTPGGPAPANTTLSVMRVTKDGGSGTSRQLPESGTFTISDVAPGTYELSARAGRGTRSIQPDERDPLLGSVRIEVTTADVEGLVVVMKAAVSLRGRVVYEDPPATPAAAPLRIGVDNRGIAFRGEESSPGTVAEDGTFELKNLFGPVVLRPQGPAPRGYVLKSVLYRGRDILDVATEFDGDPAHDVQLVFTSRTAELSGRVLDDMGNPGVEATIVRFPADSARWKNLQSFATGAGARIGNYRLPMLPAGEYFVVAVAPGALRELTLPEDYDRLAAVAERITLLENDRRVGDLRITSIPPRKKQP